MRFSVVVPWEGHRLLVVGDASRYVPAKTNCSNDDAAPAEGGIDEISEVSLLDRQGYAVDLPAPLQDALDAMAKNGAIDDKVYEAFEALTEG
jgi:hypothetical protein